jgi:hypothetical protein
MTTGKSIQDSKSVSCLNDKRLIYFSVLANQCQIELETICVPHGTWMANTTRSRLFCYEYRRRRNLNLTVVAAGPIVRGRRRVTDDCDDMRPSYLEQ